LVERIDFDKLFGWNSAGEPSATARRAGAASGAGETSLRIRAVAHCRAIIFYDNNEFNFDSDLKNDSYLFEEQLWLVTGRIGSRSRWSFALHCQCGRLWHDTVRTVPLGTSFGLIPADLPRQPRAISAVLDGTAKSAICSSC